MKVYAHRGARGYAPENTMAAFLKAQALGADGIELDVQLTRDNHIVVCHDPMIDHVSNGSGWIKDLTLAELKRYDFGTWFHPQFSRETIPTLHEVLTWISATSLHLNIEIKCEPFPHPNIAWNVTSLVEKYNLVDRVIISSFHHPSLIQSKQASPAIKTGVLFACRPVRPEIYIVDTTADYLHPHWAYLDQLMVRTARSLGVGINAYTINTLAEYHHITQYDVDVIFTDYPDLFTK